MQSNSCSEQEIIEEVCPFFSSSFCIYYNTYSYSLPPLPLAISHSHLNDAVEDDDGSRWYWHRFAASVFTPIDDSSLFSPFLPFHFFSPHSLPTIPFLSVYLFVTIFSLCIFHFLFPLSYLDFPQFPFSLLLFFLSSPRHQRESKRHMSMSHEIDTFRREFPSTEGNKKSLFYSSLLFSYFSFSRLISSLIFSHFKQS